MGPIGRGARDSTDWSDSLAVLNRHWPPAHHWLTHIPGVPTLWRQRCAHCWPVRPGMCLATSAHLLPTLLCGCQVQEQGEGGGGRRSNSCMCGRTRPVRAVLWMPLALLSAGAMLHRRTWTERAVRRACGRGHCTPGGRLFSYGSPADRPLAASGSPDRRHGGPPSSQSHLPVVQELVLLRIPRPSLRTGQVWRRQVRTAFKSVPPPRAQPRTHCRERPAYMRAIRCPALTFRGVWSGIVPRACCRPAGIPQAIRPAVRGRSAPKSLLITDI
jgi:hypothetical protein